jgi:hypothetical protein
MQDKIQGIILKSIFSSTTLRTFRLMRRVVRRTKKIETDLERIRKDLKDMK